MMLRIRALFALAVAVFVAACSSNGEPRWSPTPSTSATVLHGLGVDDRTGLVLEWEFAEDVDSWADVPDDFDWGIRQVDEQAIEVGWWALGCDDDPRLLIEADVIELTLDGYLGDRPDPEVGCASMGIWREFHLTYTEPVDTETLTLTVVEPLS